MTLSGQLRKAARLYDPFLCDDNIFWRVSEWRDPDTESLATAPAFDISCFFLLIAEALEQA